VEQSKKPSHEVVTKEQFISERWLVHSTNISSWLIWQSQEVKIQTKLSTPKEWLSLEPVSSSQNKNPHTRWWIMIMEEGNDDMETDVTT
jgi:hypothetical protein